MVNEKIKLTHQSRVEEEQINFSLMYNLRNAGLLEESPPVGLKNQEVLQQYAEKFKTASRKQQLPKAVEFTKLIPDIEYWAKSESHDNSSKRRIFSYYRNFSPSKSKLVAYQRPLNGKSLKLLQRYRENLARTTGLGPHERNFDKGVYDILSKYVYDKKAFVQEVDYLKNLVCEDGHLFSRSLKDYSTTEDAMKRFAEPDHTSFRWNVNYQNSLKQLRSLFNESFTPISYRSDDDIEAIIPKVKAHSGWHYILSGDENKRQKKDHIEGSYDEFVKLKSLALETGSFNHPILIAFRTQASGEYNDDGSQTGTGKHKTRVVSMIDMFTILAELQFAKPVQDYMSRMDIYAGGKEPKSISRIIHNLESSYSRFMSIDYSSFDQTISSWLIEDAFALLKDCFKMNSEQSKLYDIIVHDFIHKDFIVNEGVVHSDKGVPSGSMFTQIIDTIVNWLVVQTYFNSINGKAEMIIMGDDNAIFTSNDVRMSDIASYISKNFGLIIKVDDKSSEGTCGVDKVKFLSRYWLIDGEWRHPNQLISRMLYSERFRTYADDVKPEHVIFAFMLTYSRGMNQLMDVTRFQADFRISKNVIIEKVDSRYLPGAMAYIREYSMKKVR